MVILSKNKVLRLLDDALKALAHEPPRVEVAINEIEYLVDMINQKDKENSEVQKHLA